MQVDILNRLTFKIDGAIIKLSGEGFKLLFYYDENKIIITNENGKKLATTYLHDVDLGKLIEKRYSKGEGYEN